MPETTRGFGGRVPVRFADIESIVVAEWCPTPDGSGPAEQVHMVITLKGVEDTPLVLRMKTAAAVDAIIDALAEHRAGVFGER